MSEPTEAEAAVLKSLWKALDAQEVSHDEAAPAPWIDGHFDPGQLAFNFIALLKQNGFELVPLPPPPVRGD